MGPDHTAQAHRGEDHRPFLIDPASLTVSWTHGPLSTDDGTFTWTESTPAAAVSARVLRPNGTYEPTQPYTGGNGVTITESARWLTTGDWTVQLQDAGGLTVAQGTFTVAAPAALTGAFTAPRTWSWTETVAAATQARVLEPDALPLEPEGNLVPGTADMGAKTYTGEASYTPAAGDYVLQLGNANFVVINEDTVTVP